MEFWAKGGAGMAFRLANLMRGACSKDTTMVCPGGWGGQPQDARISCFLPGIARLTQTSCMLPCTSCSNPAPRQPPPRRLVQIDFATGDRQGEFTRYYFPVEAFDCTGSIKLGDVTRLQVGAPRWVGDGLQCATRSRGCRAPQAVFALLPNAEWCSTCPPQSTHDVRTSLTLQWESKVGSASLCVKDVRVVMKG